MNILICVISLILVYAEFSGDAQCRNHLGEVVDYFVILKQHNTGGSTGKRYLYFDSLMSMNGESSFLPLSDTRLIDAEDSPIIRTIYDSLPKEDIQGSNLKDPQDNTFWMAVSDQPPKDTGKTAQTAHKKASSSKDGHEKVFFAAQYHPSELFPYAGKVKGYFLHHSLPKFPKLILNTANDVQRSKFPEEKSKIFDTNLKSKAQHFICVSFKYKQIIDDNFEIPFYREGIEDHKTEEPLVVFLEFLETVRGAPLGYRSTIRKIWNQYFGIRNSSNGRILLSNIAKSDSHLFSAYPEKLIPSHLFPLIGVKKRVGVKEDGQPKVVTAASLSYITDANQFQLGKCPKWDPEDPATQCVSSGVVRTPHGTQISVMAKHGLATVNIWSDILALHTVPKSVFEYSDEQFIEVKTDLLVQSWYDRSLYPTIEKVLVDKPNIKATVTIKNISAFYFPHENGDLIKVPSNGSNHSKIGLSRGSKISIAAVIFAGGNNTGLQRQLSNEVYGRGAGGLVVYDVALWTAVSALSPETDENFLSDIDPALMYSRLMRNLQIEQKIKYPDESQ